MSRIHDALKKAEQERAGIRVEENAAASAAEVTLPLSDRSVDAAPLNDGSANEAAGIPFSVPVGMRGTEFLRFDDLKKRCAHPEWHFDPNVNVFANPALSEHGAEQFRTLRSRLYQIRTNQRLRTLLVTSSVPGEGKTFVTANLAQAIVRQSDKRALIIDADLRRPRVHSILGAPGSPGLAEYLRGEVDEAAVMQFGPEGNICLIPGGNEASNPSELLSNGRMNALLERLAPVFDWIILDSPPCLPVADASILAGICEGVILIVRAGTTPSAAAQRASQELQGRNVVGVVLNAIGDVHQSEYYQSYGYGYRSESKASTE
jgi:protein-tyrosine kinase